MSQKTFRVSVFLIIILNVFLRIHFFSSYGSIYDGDSMEYIETASNIISGHGYVYYDDIEKKIKEYTYRMPLYSYILGTVGRITNHNFELSAFIINTISIVVILLVLTKILLIMTQDRTVSIIGLILLSINSNIFYNSLTIMSDTVHLTFFIIFYYISIKTISAKKIEYFFLTGLLIAVCILTRPVLKLYWIILCIYFYKFTLKDKEIWKKIIYEAAFVIPLVIILIPYYARNYKILGYPESDTQQGITLTCSIMPLISKTDYSTAADKYPLINEIADFLKRYDLPPEKEIRKKFQLSTAQTNRYLTKIFFHTVIENPLDFLKIYFKNLINLITSPSSCIQIIDLFKKNYFKTQHEEFLSFIKLKKIEAITSKVAINIIFRILNLSVFIISLISIIKIKNIEKNLFVYNLTLLIYILFITSFTLTYDRYRIPLEIILIIHLSLFIRNFIKDNLSVRI